MSLYLLAQFDDDTQKVFSGYYDILHRNGFVGTQTKGIPYHFTLGSKDVDCEVELINDVESKCIGIAPIEIGLSHIGLFGQNTLFIAPSMNIELMNLQQNIFPECCSGVHRWVAHATVLIDEPDAIMKALPIMTEKFKPLEARIESIGIYEFFPTRFIKNVYLDTTMV